MLPASSFVWSKLVALHAPRFVSITHFAFDNYVQWFIETTRVEICPLAYNEDILEEAVNFEDLAKGKYNRDVRLGQGVPAVPVINYVVSVPSLLSRWPYYTCLNG